MRVGEAKALLTLARSNPATANESLAQVRTALPTLPPNERLNVERELLYMESALKVSPEKIGAEVAPTQAQALSTAQAGKAFSLGNVSIDINVQAKAEGRAIKSVIFSNPTLAKKINNLEETSSAWDQAGPDLIQESVLSAKPVGRSLVNAWARITEGRHDAAEAKLKPLVEQFMAEVREGVTKNGGDASRVDTHDTLYFLEQFMIDLPATRSALAKQGVNLDALAPADAAKLTESSRMMFNDKNQKVVSFPEDAVAPYRKA